MYSDNGSQFRSHRYADFLKQYGIQPIYTAYYSPQSNASERVNRSILAAIRAYIKDDHRRWDENIHQVAAALRSAVHQSTAYSPHFLMFGYHPIYHTSQYKLLKEAGLLSDSDIECLPNNYKLPVIHAKVHSNLKLAYEKYANHYNLRARTIEFRPGQTVYLRLHPQSDATNNFSAKLSPKRVKAIIMKRIGNVNYLLSNPQGKPIGMHHAKDLCL